MEKNKEEKAIHMQIGFIGLGRMGKGLVRRLSSKGFEVVAYDRNAKEAEKFARGKSNLKIAGSVPEVARKIKTPRIIWLMITAGKPVDEVIGKLLPSLSKKDVIIDGGNSHYLDSVRRGKTLAKKGIGFLDVGTSGGLEGAETGASLAIGGKREDFRKAERIFRAVSQKNGHAYVGKGGAGHFAKMVHNAIEYAMLEAYGEGFELLEKAPYGYDLKKIASVWRNGTVIRSWILELAERALRKHGRMEKVSGKIGGGKTGTWAANYASKRKIEIPAIKAALKMRNASKKKERFSGKLVAAIRNEFGGHELKMKK